MSIERWWVALLAGFLGLLITTHGVLFGQQPACACLEAAEEPGCEGLFEDDCESLWTVNVGAILLHRSKARSGILVEDGTTDVDLANISDFDLGWAAGPRVEIDRRLTEDWAIGVEYFSIDGWNAQRSLADAGNLRVPLVSHDPDDYFDTASASYGSRLYSTEIMAKRQIADCVDLSAGFRSLELHESVAAQAYSPTLEGIADLRTSNYLYGFQGGAEAVLWDRGGPLHVAGSLKAGIYGNRVKASLYGEGTYFTMDASESASRTSFVGELALTGIYQLGRHTALFAGYQAMWIDGVSLAPDLITASSQQEAMNGSPFFHGLRTGIEFVW
ncbi:MAG: hypothetical protein ACYC0X_14710 [Pirellulaceae bacterium]